MRKQSVEDLSILPLSVLESRRDIQLRRFNRLKAEHDKYSTDCRSKLVAAELLVEAYSFVDLYDKAIELKNRIK